MESNVDLPAPIAYGKQDFADVRASNSIYVDKTGFIIRFMKQPANAYFFLSRPRRFGKSLFLSTLKEAFSGNRELFQGLALYEAMPETWEKYPVIHLDFSVQVGGAYSFDPVIFMHQMQRTIYQAGLRLAEKGLFPEIKKEDLDTFDLDQPANYLGDLIQFIHEKTKKQVVILIDEYDAPILHYLENERDWSSVADLLRPIYQTLKSNQEAIRFIFVTGISRFARLSLFSSMNQINDITMNREFNAVCGYTEEEVSRYFSRNMKALAEAFNLEEAIIRDRVRFWYNGYRWGGKETIYNPIAIGKLLEEQEFKPYWIKTGGTPRFLYKRMLNNEQTWTDFTDQEYVIDFLDNFKPENLNVLTVLWQSGYLTIDQSITDAETLELRHTFRFPNFEVESAFKAELLAFLLQNNLPPHSWGGRLHDSIKQGNTDTFINVCKELIKANGYHAHADARRKDYAESFYQMILFTALTCIGMGQMEVYHYKGRKDLLITYQNRAWIVEIKHARQDTTAQALAQKALDQITARDYASGLNKPYEEILAIGIGILGQAEEVDIQMRDLKTM